MKGWLDPGDNIAMVLVVAVVVVVVVVVVVGGGGGNVSDGLLMLVGHGGSRDVVVEVSKMMVMIAVPSGLFPLLCQR